MQVYSVLDGVRDICNTSIDVQRKNFITMCVLYIYIYICIGYTLGSQCIPGIYARWFLITHEGVARGRYQ